MLFICHCCLHKSSVGEKPNRFAGLKSGCQTSLHSILSGMLGGGSVSLLIYPTGTIEPLVATVLWPTSSLMAVSARLFPVSLGHSAPQPESSSSIFQNGSGKPLLAFSSNLNCLPPLFVRAPVEDSSGEKNPCFEVSCSVILTCFAI